ncbi:MAG: NAD-dependent epimerase/dehydratase family protein [Candidatus Nanoarchaeia archaeon]
MNSLVTGGAGFIGTNLCEALIKQNHSVTVLDNLSVTSKNIAFLKSLGAEIVVADISNYNKIKNICKNIDIVFHLAAMNRAQRSIENPRLSNKWNVVGTLNMLEAARRADVKKFINISSSSVYANVPKGTLLKEDMPLKPRHPYGVDKLAGEHYTRLYQELYGLNTITLRYFSVYGPRQLGHIKHAGVIAKFIYKILHNQPIEIYGDGEQRRNFTYVDDVVDITIKAGFSKVSNEIFNVASSYEASINQIAELIQKTLNRKAQINYTKPKIYEPLENPADISKLESVFSYKPQTSIEEGIKKTINWHLTENG